MKFIKIYQVVLLSAGLSILLPDSIIAQQKATQIEFVKSLPNFRWTDDSHYKTYKGGSMMGSGKEVLVEVLSGKETEVEPIEIGSTKRTKNAVVISVNGDVVIESKSGRADTLKDIQNPTLSPDSLSIAYTKNSDLYVFSIVDKREWRVTADGSETVYNGWSSWVYNEEILGGAMAHRAFWWSPDSKKIAFMRFDVGKVPVHYIVDDSGIQEKQISVRYPLPGDANPEVKIGVANIAREESVWADYDAKTDQYFGTPIWTPSSDQLWVQWMNRGQDTLKVESVALTSGSRKSIYTETQKTWISLDQYNRITFVPTKKMFLLMSDKSGWMHIYAYNTEGEPLRQLTAGNWAVSKINYVDEKHGMVYFTAKKENSTRQDLYKIKLAGGTIQRLTFGNYMHRFELSPTAKYFITRYSNFKRPVRVALVNNNGKIIRELADSKGKDYDEYLPLVPKTEIICVRTLDGFDLPVSVTLPADIDSNKKYPLLASIYGGPNSIYVEDGYVDNYKAEEDTQKDLIRIQMDHRGSGHFGKLGQNYLHRNLGYWEIEDYSTIIKYLLQKYPFIDAKRIGISGFSYGGYLSALALVKAPDVFTVGIAGGSVTDWHLYDSAYTERFMDSPKENPEGYKSSSVLTYAKNLIGHLSLAQGTMDDNVHMYNTMKLVDALQEAGKPFELMFYPGAAHGWQFMKNKAAYYKKAQDLFIDKYLIQGTDSFLFLHAE